MLSLTAGNWPCMHACVSAARRTARPIDLLQANGVERARGVLSCARAAVTDRPGSALVCVRTCSRVRSMHACMLRAGQRAAAARAARRGTRPAGTHGLATAYDGIDDMHGHWPEHSCWDLRLCDCVSAYWSDSVDINHLSTPSPIDGQKPKMHEAPSRPVV